jgi:hypothetical protein
MGRPPLGVVEDLTDRKSTVPEQANSLVSACAEIKATPASKPSLNQQYRAEDIKKSLRKN